MRWWMARLSDVRPEVQGQKRPADNGLEDEQPLTKKLGRLHIGGQFPRLNGDAPPKPTITTAPSIPQCSSWASDSMLVDETKDRIYVHDLDKELEDLEAQEQDVAFLPEIEKRLTAIPKSVLKPEKPANNELVLYRLPTSLTVSEDKDNVRRVVADARKRAKEAEQSHESKPSTESKNGHESKIDPQDAANHIEPIGDVMDIDD